MGAPKVDAPALLGAAMLSRDRRYRIACCAAFVLVALTTLAAAQRSPSSVECRDSESGAECLARLKCTPYENLKDCQMRLLRCSPDESLDECKRRVRAQRGGDNGGDRDRRSDDDRSGRDRGDGGSRDDGRTRGDDGRDSGSRADRGGGRGDDGGRRGRGRRGRRGGGGGGAHDFEANKTIGLGLELGEPTGLTGKLFVSPDVALDFGLGWIYRHYYYDDGVHLYGDVLFHPVSLVSAEAFELPLYIGGGLRYWDFDYCDMGVCTYGGSAIGIRVPVGISFDFNNVPLDIFMQFVPVIDFLRGDYYDRYRDRTHVGIDASIGIRFYFK